VAVVTAMAIITAPRDMKENMCDLNGVQLTMIDHFACTILYVLYTRCWPQQHQLTLLTYDIRLVSEYGRPHFHSSSNRTLFHRWTSGDKSNTVARLWLWNSLSANLWQM